MIMPKPSTKTVVYYVPIGCEIKVGHRANVKTINDPREYLRDAHWVHTTEVQAYDEVTGTFITKNTAYHLYKEKE